MVEPKDIFLAKQNYYLRAWLLLKKKIKTLTSLASNSKTKHTRMTVITYLVFLDKG